MKPLHVLCFLFFNLIINAQTNNGIAVQGIARDDISAAIVNQTLSFTFVIASNSGTDLFTETQTIYTDNFGVFSHIIGTGSSSGASFDTLDFSDQGLIVKVYIEHNGNNILTYNRPFNYTPYAHYSRNGAPVGAIMPYVGANAPEGWLICNGAAIPSHHTKLITLLGSNNTPNLQGLFLRGTGTTSVNNQSGPALNTTQQDSFKSHDHYVSLTTSNNGGHTHQYKDHHQKYESNGWTNGGADYALASSTWRTTNSSGEHTHNVSGNTNNAGSSETRPVNYGVNYIIKY